MSEELAKQLREQTRASEDGKPEGTWESLGQCARMLEQWLPEALPANDKGQVPFIRTLAETTCDEITAFLAHSAKMKFQPGDRVKKISGSRWQGLVVGYYSTTLTPEGYCVESETECGSVQIYPAKALELVHDKPSNAPSQT